MCVFLFQQFSLNTAIAAIKYFHFFCSSIFVTVHLVTVITHSIRKKKHFFSKNPFRIINFRVIIGLEPIIRQRYSIRKKYPKLIFSVETCNFHYIRCACFCIPSAHLNTGSNFYANRSNCAMRCIFFCFANFFCSDYTELAITYIAFPLTWKTLMFGVHLDDDFARQLLNTVIRDQLDDVNCSLRPLLHFHG